MKHILYSEDMVNCLHHVMVQITERNRCHVISKEEITQRSLATKRISEKKKLDRDVHRRYFRWHVRSSLGVLEGLKFGNSSLPVGKKNDLLTLLPIPPIATRQGRIKGDTSTLMRPLYLHSLQIQ